jgi:hypothetical protein
MTGAQTAQLTPSCTRAQWGAYTHKKKGHHKDAYFYLMIDQYQKNS